MYKRFFAFFSIILLSISSFQNVSAAGFADPLADSSDIFIVNQPSPNQRLAGETTITWTSYDDEQNSIPYNINLYDAQTCQNTNLGQINTSATGFSSTTSTNNVNWNTRSTVSTANLNDGNYCLRICLALKNGTTPYTACNGRIVRVLNNNSLPSITSLPSNLTIGENESWQYQIQATDPDSDTLTYRLIIGANFLTVNPQTGLVSTNNSSRNLAAGVNRADYTLVIAVDDGVSGSVIQQFVLIIVRGGGSGTPSPQPTPSPTPVPPSTTNVPSEITFIKPTEGEIFNIDNSTIEWSVNDNDGVATITLNYSQDGNTWTKIELFQGDVLPKDFNWDLSELEDGDYYVQLVVKDDLGAEVSKVSPKFTIKKEPEQPIGSVPLIINTAPQNNAEIVQTKPEISGEFVPSDDQEIDIDSFKISLDEKDILDKCEVTKTFFKCILDEALEIGRHKVSVSINDTGEKTASYEWGFDIINESINQTEEPKADVVLLFGREIPRTTFFIFLFICCLASLLLFIPWLLYSLWFSRRRDREDMIVEEPFISTTPNDTYSYITPSPEVTTNFYTPENYPYADLTQPVVTDYAYNPPAPEAQQAAVQSDTYFNYQPTQTTIEPQIQPEIQTPVEPQIQPTTQITIEPQPQPVVSTEPAIQQPTNIENNITVQPQPITPQPPVTNPADITPLYNPNDYYNYVDPNGNVSSTNTTGEVPPAPTAYVEPEATDK